MNKKQSAGLATATAAAGYLLATAVAPIPDPIVKTVEVPVEVKVVDVRYVDKVVEVIKYVETPVSREGDPTPHATDCILMRWN